jgi:hypothetical protein
MTSYKLQLAPCPKIAFRWSEEREDCFISLFTPGAQMELGKIKYIGKYLNISKEFHLLE